MKLFTNNNEAYEVKFVEYWSENKRVFLAETKDGELLEIDEDNFCKVEE